MAPMGPFCIPRVSTRGYDFAKNQGCEQHGAAVWCDEQLSGLFVRARGSTGSPLWQGAFAARLLYATNPDVWEM